MHPEIARAGAMWAVRGMSPLRSHIVFLLQGEPGYWKRDLLSQARGHGLLIS